MQKLKMEVIMSNEGVTYKKKIVPISGHYFEIKELKKTPPLRFC